MKINERFTWALSILSPSPNDNILEIGCGNGILTEQIALQLKSGTITAIDRSKPSIKQAEKRNADHIKSKRVKLITSDFPKASFQQHQFDKIVAFNVNIFWKGSDKDFELIRHCLSPKGKLYVFYQTPSGIDLELAQQITGKLQENKFTIISTLFKKPPIGSFCVVSTVS